MKSIFRVLLLAAAIGAIYYGFKQSNVRLPLSLLSPISDRSDLPTWTEEKVITDINNYREAKDMGLLASNEKLNDAAKARLAVILEYEDIKGDVTGLSREAVLSAVDYEHSWIGDLAVVNFFRTNDPVSYWASIDNARVTLDEPNLKEIGVAIKQEGETVSIYVLMATQRSSTPVRVSRRITWGGPELWAAVNTRRVELGVNPLSQRDELCTIAAIRLNQILDLGRLDAHAGFEPTLNREDLKWIAEKYNISEFLVSGYETPEAAIDAWENTLGHKKLLAGGEYVWGCIYAQNGFGVAIAAY